MLLKFCHNFSILFPVCSVTLSTFQRKKKEAKQHYFLYTERERLINLSLAFGLMGDGLCQVSTDMRRKLRETGYFRSSYRSHKLAMILVIVEERIVRARESEQTTMLPHSKLCLAMMPIRVN